MSGFNYTVPDVYKEHESDLVDHMQRANPALCINGVWEVYTDTLTMWVRIDGSKIALIEWESR